MFMKWLSVQSRMVIGVPEEIMDKYVEEMPQIDRHVVGKIHGTSLWS
jgi:hypothetical protein